MNKPVIFAVMMIVLLVLVSATSATAAGRAVQTIIVPRTLEGATDDITLYDSGWVIAGRTVGLDVEYPDLVVSVPSPDDGASSPPFCVGQAVDWYTTVTNQGSSEADGTDLGYYIGTSSSDFGNRVNSDAVSALAPNGGSSAEHEVYTFSAADGGTRHFNVWADYADNLEEENEDNNQNSYGPFQVIPIPAVPSLTSPANGSSRCEERPTFSWGNVSGATSYQIQVDDSSSFSSPEIDQITSSTSYTPATALSPGTYYWHVRASNACGDGAWSAAWNLTILSAPPLVPLLSSPSNGSSTCEAAPTFSWSSVSEASSYRIQVDNSVSFASPEIDRTTSDTSITPGTSLPPDTYYWRVQASNACGEGSWSSTWSITILSAPGAPSLSAPPNGSTVSDDTPTFHWGSVSGATAYRIQVAEDASFSSPAINDTTSSTSYTPTSALSEDTTYYWRVQANNDCGSGSWSAVWQFTVDTICPTPREPLLSTPSDGSNTCDTTPTFGWSSVSGATSYRIQVDNNFSFSSTEIDQTTSGTSYTPGTSLPADTYYWRVRASNVCGDGAWSSTWQVEIRSIPGKTSLLSPANESTVHDDTPTFSWGSVSGVGWYRIQVADNSGFSSPTIDETTFDTSYIPTSALSDDTTYYWRVQASNGCGSGSWSTVWQFAVDMSCPTPPEPTLSIPADRSSTCEATPTFSWGSVSGAMSYRIQVDDSLSFSAPEINQTTSGTSYTPGTALPPGSYYWRVQASNTCGNGSWSVTWSFSVLSTPVAPSLFSPPNGSSTDDTTPCFEWSPVSQATSYRIQVDDNPGFSSPEVDHTTSSVSHTPATVLTSSTYYWHVRASNSCGDGPWSSPIWSFTVTLEADAISPAAITDLSANAGRTVGTVDLSWTAPGDDGSVGRASTYIVRYYTTRIIEGNWDASSDVNGEPAPGPAGSVESMTVSGLTPGERYYFAVKTQDEVSNTSEISNSPYATSRSYYCTYLPVVLKKHHPWDAYYEPNGHWLSAYGPLASGQIYRAYPDDTEDYFYFELPAKETVNVHVDNYVPTSEHGTVALYGPVVRDELGDLIDYYRPRGDSSMSLGPFVLDPGKYYVRVRTIEGHYSKTQLYSLTVTY